MANLRTKRDRFFFIPAHALWFIIFHETLLILLFVYRLFPSDRQQRRLQWPVGGGCKLVADDGAMEGGGVPGGDGVGDARRLGLVLPRHRQRRRARPPERSLTRVVVGVIQPQPDPPGQFCCVCPRMFFLYIVNLIQYCAFFPYTMMHKRVYSLPSMCLRQISIARMCSILRILSSSFLGNRIWAGVPWPRARELRAASCLLCGVVRL